MKLSGVAPKGYLWLSLAVGTVLAGGTFALTNTASPQAAAPAASGAKGGGNAQGGGGSAQGGGNGNTEKGKNFTMSGAATGLYPGADRPLVLTVNNPDSQDIRVQSVTVQVSNATGQCPGSLLSVGSFTPFVVAGRGSGTTTLQIHMSSAATNTCRNRTWTLTYTGTAVKA